jgi:hypothetical protein
MKAPKDALESMLAIAATKPRRPKHICRARSIDEAELDMVTGVFEAREG